MMSFSMMSVLIVFVSLFFSAFFSAIEIAFVSADRLRLALKRNEKGFIARSLAYFYEKEDFFIGTTLTGNTIALVVYGIYMAKIMDDPLKVALEPMITTYLSDSDSMLSLLVLLAQTLLSTLIVLLTAEFLPKSIALGNPNRLLEVLIPVMRAVYILFYPFVWLVMQLARLTVKKGFKIPYNEKSQTLGISDLHSYLQQLSHTESVATDLDVDVFKNAIEFGSLRVRDCMIPRTEIVAIDQTDSIENLRDKFITSGHSKIVVYNNDIDEVTGYCHALRMYNNPQSITEILTTILHVPAAMLVHELMTQFISTQKSIALVTDEYGGTAGIVTIEDIIEEILGDIEDEHDADDLYFIQKSENIYELSARHHIEDLNEKHKWQIPESDDYETLAGLVLHSTGTVPPAGTFIELESLSLKVTQVSGAKVELVEIKIKPTENER
ncbi:MAG: HlyC/CorC family transporter [Bernardetiaceae bacterium]|nr:HlyC/CorC family transporter [Bernardetiaceae bacterium]